MAYVAGHYTATFNSVDIGDTAEGFDYEERPFKEPIHGDSGGDTELDAVLRGGEVTVRLRWIEYAKVKALMGIQQGGVGKSIDNVGKLISTVLQALVLTPAAGTPAASDAGAWTFHKCVPDESFSFALKAGLRSGPLTFKCYPDSGNANKFFTIASGS